MAKDTHNLITDYQNAYPVSEMPQIQGNDHIVMQSLPDLKRLCSDFNLPLLFMLRGKVTYSGVLSSPDTVYSVFFTNKDGLYFVFFLKETKPDELVEAN